MALRFIGTGKTDNTGVAVMNKNANGTSINHSYTGIGAGEVDFIAKYTIDNSILVSEIYELLDVTFYDKGLSGTGNHNDNWQDTSNKISINRESDGTTLTIESGQSWRELYAQSSSTFFTNPFCVELTVLSVSDTPTLRFTSSSSGVSHVLTTGVWKFNMGTDSITVFQDGVEVRNWLSAVTGLDCKVSFQFSADTDVIKYKDFKIYPI